ncbi:RNase adapter RapZ [Caldicellulosiruptor naganoensis]|uniref:RNase adapter RapZ n=1 Tax=Caldicellulosiruptor naganoensis TaxID=29324 RepID=A0ABY7BJS1_9FIRM|nr:RNase adapter RapZ [Caldicellulosiruptor naganoensis]WAM31995.1 RNase adapter RapZ [Caldicellulosiruptor naganoensis]
METVVITGMSGAGKSLAIRAFEDMGFFCIDNLPPQFLPKIAELASATKDKISKVAAVVDIRGGELFDDFKDVLNELKKGTYNFKLLFLDAHDNVLIQRYKETRRKHPLSLESEGSILEAIQKEREKLEDIKRYADFIIDTSTLSPKELKEKLFEIFSAQKSQETMLITIMSFGFKYGLPLDADLVFDVRFIPNPFYIDELKHKTGKEKEVKEYVLRWDVTKKFLDKLFDLILFLIPNYAEEGKGQLVIAIGCTGGKHRSVTIAEELFELIKNKGYRTSIFHRDIEKDIKG